MSIYFDNSATTKIKQEVLKEMMPYLTENYGNPSSLYKLGRDAKRGIEVARERVAKLINANTKEIYFTSCGSESDNWALKGIAFANKDKNHIITSKIEHHAILETCEFLEKQGYDITYLNVDKDGIVNLEELVNSIKDTTCLISVMFANNEIGTIEPIEKIGKIAKENNIVFHTDAVQAVGNIDIDVEKIGIDMLSLSGHKINAPKGVGALYIRTGINIEKYLNGGHQEKGKRSGTENVASIVGLGKACEIARMNLKTHASYLKYIRNYYIEQVIKRVGNIKINGSMENRLPGNANISFIGSNSSELLFELDKRGIAVSAGSACNSGDPKPSHVLTAIGLDSSFASSAIRTTFSEYNTKEDVDYLVDSLVNILK